MEEASLDRVSLLGWSLGGFLAADFASQNPYRVNELNLVSIREKYDPERLKEIKINLGKNKKAFLYRFYLECFAKAEKEELSWFKKRLLKAYTEEFTLDLLNEGLDYLSSARIDQRTFGGIKKVRFFHGEEDIVAPAREGERVSASVENSQWVCFPKTGHMPFLNASFHERFENG